MATIKVIKSSSVKSIKAQFTKEFAFLGRIAKLCIRNYRKTKILKNYFFGRANCTGAINKKSEKSFSIFL